jgi:hypothetical protein
MNHDERSELDDQNEQMICTEGDPVTDTTARASAARRRGEPRAVATPK